MSCKRALFITLSSIGATAGAMSPLAVGPLQDFVARGYQIILVTDRLEVGGQSFRNRIELLAALRRSGHKRHALPVSDVILLENAFDPVPFWDAARRFNLSLSNSTYVSSHGEHAAAARNAGVMRNEPSGEMFPIAA